MSDRRRALTSVEALAARVAQLEQLVARLAGAGARDQEDVALVGVIYEQVASRVAGFTMSQIVREATRRPELAAAIRRADIDTAQQLGQLFRRLQGRDLDGLVIERLREVRAGWRWRVRDLRG